VLVTVLRVLQEPPDGVAFRRIAEDPSVNALLAKSKTLRGDGKDAFWPQFFQAVRDGDDEVNYRGLRFSSPLMQLKSIETVNFYHLCMLTHDWLQWVKCALADNATLSKQSEPMTGFTALHWAATYDRHDCALALIEVMAVSRSAIHLSDYSLKLTKTQLMLSTPKPCTCQVVLLHSGT
jgi:hypothetical protein